SFALLKGAGTIALRWESTPVILRTAVLSVLAADRRAVLVGDWDGSDLREPELVALAEDSASDADDRRVVRLARYHGLDGRLVRAAVMALAGPLGRLRETLPAEIVAAARLIPAGEAIAGLHLRGSSEARRRLALEE